MKLKYVDGYKIRQTLDPEFSVIHFHNPDMSYYDSKWYIPEGEIWFDVSFKGEEKFLKKILLSKVKSREEIKKKFCKKGKMPNFIVAEEMREDLKIQYVDGKIIREYIDPEFVFGGHDLVYDYVPKNTVWIDNRIDKRDVIHTLVHEIFERGMMAQGECYDIAHEYATVREKESRRSEGGAYIGDANRTEDFDIKKYYAR